MRIIPLLLAVAGLASGAVSAAPIRVLILTGSNNHDWRSTTPVLRQTLEQAGRFQVDVETNVTGMTTGTFAPYDVLLSNFNDFGMKAGTPVWSPEVRAAFVSFIRGGKGFVVVHAGSSSFYDWPEFQQLAGATWKNGQTSHNAPHTFTVTPSSLAHPVTQGLAPFTTTDELWLKVGLQPDAAVLATADAQPVALATALGQGRGFTLLLGHDAGRMGNPGFQVLLVRGTEWAATGQAATSAADLLIRSVSTYEHGRSRSPLLAAGRQAQLNPREWAPKLAALLSSDATLDAKKFACEQLSLVGSDAEVPALARLIGQPDLDFAARFALERISGSVSLAALRDALPKATGATQAGLQLALGARGDAGAVPAIAAGLPEGAAIDALGLIGDQAALQALIDVESKVAGTNQGRWATAMLKCAGRLRSIPMLDRLCATNFPAPVRAAAFIQRVTATAADGGAMILAAWSGTDAVLQEAAMSVLQTSTNPALISRLAAGLDSLAPSAQEQVLMLVAERGDASALPAAAKAAASGESTVRLAALKALGALGNHATVPVAVSLLESANDDAARKPITDSLARMRGTGVDEAILAALPKSTPATSADLIRALVTRDARTAVPAFLVAARAADAGVRHEAIRGLQQLASIEAAPGVIALLDQPAEADRADLEAALVAICRRADTIAPLTEAVAKAAGPKRASLVAALGALGRPEALPALRAALKDADIAVQTAAARTLPDWPDAAPLEDLLAAAETMSDVKIKALALRGVARLAPLAKDKDTKALAALLKRALAAGGREEENALLKSVLVEMTGGNLARGATAVNTDGLAPDFAGGGPQAAVDGNRATYWDETDNQKAYGLKVTMKRPATVRVLRIVGFNQQEYAPRDFAVLCDGAAVKQVAGALYTDNVATVELPPTRCTTVELKISAAYGPSPAIRELELFGEEE
jgi:type 1 glutamine amidotransferase/HEAT repeat protein